jgi:antitoxin (DNA-binding transcriptional repressor) of toxin-antitoxin stability system
MSAMEVSVMQKVNLKEAESRLGELIEEAARGEEIIIVRNDGSSFKILPMAVEKPFPKFGSAKGLVEMSDDFDEPLADFEDYAP